MKKPRKELPMWAVALISAVAVVCIYGLVALYGILIGGTGNVYILL